jgi:paraquat-inducible protein B
MGNKAAALRVGLLLVVGVAAAIGLVMFLGRGKVEHGVRFESYFRESVQGLDVGAPVKYRGVTLGQVTAIGLVTADYMTDRAVDLRQSEARMVVVRGVIDPARFGHLPDPETEVKLGLRARLASHGITGLVYIELDYVDPQRYPPEPVPWQPRDMYIPSIPSTLMQVQDAAQALIRRLQGIDIGRLAQGLQMVLDDLHTEITRGDAHLALTEATRLMTTLRLSTEAADLPGLARDMRALSASLRGTVESKDTKALLANAALAADRLSAATARLPALIAAVEASVRRADAGAADVQAELVPILRDARAAAANLRETTETLRRYPASVLLGAPPPHREEGPSR